MRGNQINWRWCWWFIRGKWDQQTISESQLPVKENLVPLPGKEEVLSSQPDKLAVLFNEWNFPGSLFGSSEVVVVLMR